MKYQTIWREKTKKFNTNKNDILNKRGKCGVDLIDEEKQCDVDMDGFENYELLDTLLSNCLTERERNVMDLRMDGLTKEQIGKNIINVNTGEYGISTTRVGMIIDKSMRKMRYFVRHIGNSLNVSDDGR